MKYAGNVLFALGLAGLGALSLLHRGFALAWQPVPDTVPHRELLASLSGGILLVCGVGLLIPRIAKWAASLLAIFLSSWLLLQIAFRLAPSPMELLRWVTFAETLMLVSGGWILVAQRSPVDLKSTWGFLSGKKGQRCFQFLYAIAPPVISLSHFVFSKGTANMIPTWFPFRLFFAYFTGVSHAAAGIGILTGFAPRLAATLEAIMIGMFVLLVHVPVLIAHPTSRLLWTMLFIATACTGASAIVAASFDKSPRQG